MHFYIRHIGGKPARILEFTVETYNSKIEEDILDFTTHKVSEEFIHNLEHILKELKEHNLQVDETLNQERK